MKKIYTHKGYYNDLDAVMNCDLEPKEVVTNINNGVGNFFTCEDEETDDEQHLIDNGGRIEGNIIVVDSVSEICKQMPFDLLMAQNLSDEYVDVWEFSHTEE